MLHYDINDLNSVRQAYQKATSEEQERILSVICDRKTWGYGREYAIKLFSPKNNSTRTTISEAIARSTFSITWKHES